MMNNQSHKSLLESIIIITEDVPEKYKKFTRKSPEEREKIPVEQRTRWQYGDSSRFHNQMFSHAFEVEIHRHMHNATDLLYTGLLNQHAKKGESIHEHHDDIVARMPEHEQTIIKGLNRKIHEHGDAIQTHNTAVMQLGMGDETKMNKLSSKVRQSAFDYVDALKDNGDLDHEIVRQARGEVHAHAGGYDELMADHLPKIDVPKFRSTERFGGPVFAARSKPSWKSGGVLEGMEEQLTKHREISRKKTGRGGVVPLRKDQSPDGLNANY